ncbi:MAG TPA: MFS transporter, partial [Micromonosporaceae bacterium]
RLLRNRPFVIYWLGGVVSNIGTWLQNVTASVVVLQLTHSPLMVGVLNLATFAPIFAFSMVGGAVSDRFDRRHVIVWTQLFSLAVAIAITVLSALGQLGTWSLITLAALLGCSYSLAKPAFSALLPSLVERKEVARATALNTLQFNLGQVLGSAMSPLLLTVGSATTAFAVNSVSFVGPIVAMLLLWRTPLRETGGRTALRGSSRAGIALVRRTPALLSLLVAVALSNAAVEGLRTLAPDLASTGFHVSSNAAGLLVTSYSIGATVGLVLFGQISRRLRPGLVLTLAFVAQAAGLLGVALSPALPAAVALSVPIGLGFATNIPILSAGLQVLSPEDFRGRVMSMFSIFHLGLRPIFSLTAGGLASLIDVRWVLAIFVVFPAVAMTVTSRSGRALSEAHRGPDVREPVTSPGAAPSTAEQGAS